MNGPKWLGVPASGDQDQDMPMPLECAVEMRAKDRDATLNLLVASDGPSLDQVIQSNDYSSFQKAPKCTCEVTCAFRFLGLSSSLS